MPQSLVKNYVHLTFSTKNRYPFINEEIKEELFKYLGGISVDPLKLRLVERYIKSQVDHHKNVSFKKEYRTFLNDNKVIFNERYMWD